MHDRLQGRSARRPTRCRQVAIALANGETPETTGTVRDDTGNRDVASILETPQAITKANVKDVVDAGGVTAAEVCTADYAAACTDAGIS